MTDYFAKTKKSGPRTLAAFSELWEVDEKRDIARACFAGDWARVVKTEGEWFEASEVISAYANGQYVKVDAAVRQHAQHVVRSVYAFAERRVIENGEKPGDLVVVASVEHALATGPWESKPLIWSSVDEGKIQVTPRIASMDKCVFNVKNGIFESDAASNKYFEERAEGYASTADDLIPMFWQVPRKEAVSKKWSFNNIYAWIDRKREVLIERRAEELEKLMSGPVDELSKADFAKRFQAQMGKLT